MVKGKVCNFVIIGLSKLLFGQTRPAPSWCLSCETVFLWTLKFGWEKLHTSLLILLIFHSIAMVPTSYSTGILENLKMCDFQAWKSYAKE